MATVKRNALGRGLDALISMEEIKTGGSSSISDIAISKIEANPDQPRKEFDPVALEELAASIREVGVIQPISLRKIADDKYQIIAGERRYRASKLAGLEAIPAYVRTVEDETMVEMALIENIQREDLNSIEVALTFQKLIEQYQLTQEQLSTRVGKKRATIANYLRLLKLPAEVQLGLTNKAIEMGHARALLGVDSPSLQLKAYELTVANGYSVRKVEEIVKALANGETIEGVKATATKPAMSEEYNILKQHLSSFFRTKVQFSCDNKGKGKISIPFQSEEELERLISIFDKLQ